jgi:hypothetical protein
MDSTQDLSHLSVEELQEKLARTEERFEPLVRQGLRDGSEWKTIANDAKLLRQRLFDLTGDWYGRPKIKGERPSDDLLNAPYDSPEDVPAAVLAWVTKSSILSSDATDAVRWSRIIDTQDDDRYPAGDITLYRAIGRGPRMLEEIRPGDWVTTDREYAEDHLRRWLGGRGVILSITADGQDVLISPTGNDEEAIYAPYDFSAALVMRDEPRVRKPARRP